MAPARKNARRKSSSLIRKYRHILIKALKYDIMAYMKAPDPDRVRSERQLSEREFLATYNENLPAQFPKATPGLLKVYRERYPGQFKEDIWSLDQHRKKFMDWLPMHLKALAKSAEKPKTSLKNNSLARD
jgi:hypothetical protein